MVFNKNGANIFQESENTPQSINLVWQTKSNGETNNFNDFMAKGKVIPGTVYKLHKNELSAQTDYSTQMKKKERPPSTRIKRSSSKKKSKLKFHSNDSKNRREGLDKLRNSEEFDHRKTSVQCTIKMTGGHHTRYQGLSTKTDQGEIYDKALWDKRFIEFSGRMMLIDIIPRPDINLLKRILETEKDER